MPLREFIAYLPQQSFMFAGTVRDNIKMGNSSASENEVLAAAEKAGVISFIQKGETLWTYEESMAYTKKSTRLKKLKGSGPGGRRSAISNELVKTPSFDDLSDMDKTNSFQDLKMDMSDPRNEGSSGDDLDVTVINRFTRTATESSPKKKKITDRQKKRNR